MNKLETELLKRAKKIVFSYLCETIKDMKTESDKEKAETFYLDVLDSGILLDINKLKRHGLNRLEKELKKRSI